MTAGVAIVHEGFHTSFANRVVLRRYLVLPLVLGLTLVVAWPRVSFAAIVGSGGSSETFLWVAVSLLLVTLYLASRLGAEDFSPDAASHVRDYAVLTPVSLASVVAGKLIFGFLHTLFLSIMGAPFLIAALTVSGAEWRDLGRALAVIAGAGIAARMYGMLLLALTGPRALARATMLIPGIVVYLLCTFLFAPSFNPLQILIDLSRHTPVETAHVPLSLPGPVFSVLTAAALAGVFAGASLGALAAVRRRAAREKADHV